MKKNNWHISQSGKGGVGKSFFSRVMTSYFKYKKKEVNLFDADVGLKDLQKYYPQASTDIYFDLQSDQATLSVDMSEKLLSIDGDVLINLPANVEGTHFNPKTGQDELKGIDFWLKNNGLVSAKSLKRANIDIWHWYLSNGSDESKKLFEFMCKTYGKFHKIVLVKNIGITNSWGAENKPLEVDTAFKTIAEQYCTYGYHQFYLPNLRLRIIEAMNDTGLTMEGYAGCTEFTFLIRSPMAEFLANVYNSFNKILGVNSKPIDFENVLDYAEPKYEESLEKDKPEENQGENNSDNQGDNQGENDG